MTVKVSEPYNGTLRSADEVLQLPFDSLKFGERFRSKARTITETDVVNFAAMTGDWNSLHSDAVFAEQSVFGERVAHGLLIMTYAIGLVPNDYVVALRRIKNVVFKRPVRFGDTVHVEGYVAKLVPISDEVGLVTGRWTIVNQGGQTSLKMEIEGLWRRAPL